jgi:hypothetical protein
LFGLAQTLVAVGFLAAGVIAVKRFHPEMGNHGVLRGAT